MIVLLAISLILTTLFLLYTVYQQWSDEKTMGVTVRQSSSDQAVNSKKHS
ncbi:hypothetical protein PEDI_37160 [Persicobacter diffluens]|uniref:Uncharacterized protein n=1 Tax=Persicobacter diffluens TaxID=981 RepID=A0AAN4VZW9_9BACT|nr:hypothetical protein PEDI_37160 [Persicobacter diffluens]